MRIGILARWAKLSTAAVTLILALLSPQAGTESAAEATEPVVKSGPLADENFFPLAVWL
jgi:hypothetical protein